MALLAVLVSGLGARSAPDRPCAGHTRSERAPLGTPTLTGVRCAPLGPGVGHGLRQMGTPALVEHHLAHAESADARGAPHGSRVCQERRHGRSIPWLSRRAPLLAGTGACGAPHGSVNRHGHWRPQLATWTSRDSGCCSARYVPLAGLPLPSCSTRLTYSTDLDADLAIAVHPAFSSLE